MYLSLCLCLLVCLYVCLWWRPEGCLQSDNNGAASYCFQCLITVKFTTCINGLGLRRWRAVAGWQVAVSSPCEPPVFSTPSSVYSALRIVHSAPPLCIHQPVCDIACRVTSTFCIATHYPAFVSKCIHDTHTCTFVCSDNSGNIHVSLFLLASMLHFAFLKSFLCYE